MIKMVVFLDFTIRPKYDIRNSCWYIVWSVYKEINLKSINMLKRQRFGGTSQQGQ